ncbi:MAG: cystathionine gamma-synthase family protein [Caulobacter sp.]|nr:cystathionine gamma-synthase family protein [Vitreoscilla sp.]
MTAPTQRAYGATTRLLHSDRLGGVEAGGSHKPLHLSAAFSYPTARDLAEVFQGIQSGPVYARQGNPTGAALEAKVTLLEDGKGTACFSTGMAAISAVFLSLLRSGDHVVSSRFLFGNTNSLMQTLLGLGISVSFVDATDVDAVGAAITPATRLVFVETIANPVTQVSDLEGIGRLCRERGLLYVVDGTMTTPVLMKARSVDAGLVVHALTKGFGGHGNAMGGAVVDTGLFDWSTFHNILPAYRKGPPASWGLLQIRKKGLRDLGATLRAEDAHRLAVGAETMALRIPRACDNALAMARWLEQQPAVARVHYPGLASHAQHERAAALFQGGFGPLMSFELREGIDCFAFLDALQLVIVSSHLADNRTLAIPVAQTIFFEMGPERRAEMGISEGLIRLSVGIEDIADLIDDFSRALEAVAS